MSKNEFTPREIEILNLLADGNGRKEIIILLVISPNTLNTHFKSLFLKTETKHITELTVWSLRNGYGKPQN